MGTEALVVSAGPIRQTRLAPQGAFLPSNKRLRDTRTHEILQGTAANRNAPWISPRKGHGSDLPASDQSPAEPPAAVSLVGSNLASIQGHREILRIELPLHGGAGRSRFYLVDRSDKAWQARSSISRGCQQGRLYYSARGAQLDDGRRILSGDVVESGRPGKNRRRD